MSYMDFSSWPREQEQSFVVYEQRASEASKKAMTLGVTIGAICFVIMVAIYMGVAPTKHDYSKDMNMDNLTKKSKREAPAPAPAAAPAEPAAAAPAAEAAESAETEEKSEEE